MKSLRGQLFRSHLLVMVVALGVMVSGALLAAAAVGALSGLDVVDVTGRDGPRDGHRADGLVGLGPVGLLLPLAAAAVAASSVSWQVARRLAGPLEAAHVATHRLAEGSYDVAVPGGSISELADLADSINQLAAELKESEERRLRLIGDVAHELRNPLSTIEASMEALMDGVIPATDETFARVGGEAARLRRLAADLGDLSAAVEPSAPTSRAPVELPAIVDRVIAQLQPQAEAKQLDLSATRSDEETGQVVLGDEDRLIQVFTNVIGNAVQYTDAGRITVHLHTVPPDSSRLPAGPAIVVTVTDTGRGLAAEDTSRIFERFHRVDRHGDGTGIGLAIARAVVASHGGSISAHSEGLGRGSSFVVLLPTLPTPTTSR